MTIESALLDSAHDKSVQEFAKLHRISESNAQAIYAAKGRIVQECAKVYKPENDVQETLDWLTTQLLELKRLVYVHLNALNGITEDDD